VRAWHLVGLRQAGGERLTFRLPEGGTPLMLPSTIPSGDQEQIIAFFQHVAGDEPLARVEIDWQGCSGSRVPRSPAAQGGRRRYADEPRHYPA